MKELTTTQLKNNFNISEEKAIELRKKISGLGFNDFTSKEPSLKEKEDRMELIDLIIKSFCNELIDAEKAWEWIKEIIATPDGN